MDCNSAKVEGGKELLEFFRLRCAPPVVGSVDQRLFEIGSSRKRRPGIARVCPRFLKQCIDSMRMAAEKGCFYGLELETEETMTQLCRLYDILSRRVDVENDSGNSGPDNVVPVEIFGEGEDSISLLKGSAMSISLALKAVSSWNERHSH